MSIALSVIWCVSVLAVMILTNRYYVPFLVKRAKNKTDNQETEIDPAISSNKAIYIISGICALFSGVSGFMLGNPEKGVSMVSGLIALTVANMVLACVFITDMQLKLIPNLCSLILLATRAVTLLTDFFTSREFFVGFLIQCTIAGLGCLIIFFLVSKITRGGIGMGDVKILSCLGFLCGLKTLAYSLFLSLVVASVISLVLIIIKKKNVKDALPFGPMIWIGFEIAALLCLV